MKRRFVLLLVMIAVLVPQVVLWIAGCGDIAQLPGAQDDEAALPLGEEAGAALPQEEEEAGGSRPQTPLGTPRPPVRTPEPELVSPSPHTPRPSPTVPPTPAPVLKRIYKNLYARPDGSYEVDNPILAGIGRRAHAYFAFQIDVSGSEFTVRATTGSTTREVQNITGPSTAAELASMSAISLDKTGDATGVAAPENHSAWAAMVEGRPVFWRAAQNGGDARLCFLIPHHLVPLSLRISRGGRALVLSIKHSPYKIVTLGDSMVWGQGLPRDAKFTTKTREYVEDLLPDQEVELRVLAHSGAIIGPVLTNNNRAANSANGDWHSEIPRARPTIHAQLEELLGEEAGERVDLVVMDGCINDVNPIEIVLSTLSADQLRSRVRSHCLDRMKALLELTRQGLPNATILVLGYYPIMSEHSWAGPCPVLGLFVGDPLAPMASLILAGTVNLSGGTDRSAAFRSASDTRLGEAVNSVASITPGSGRAIFVRNAEFNTTHSAFAVTWPEGSLIPESTAWLYGLDCGPCIPEDPLAMPVGACAEGDEDVQQERRDACWDTYAPEDVDNLDDVLELPSVGISLTICNMASGFHPNRSGANAYYRAIQKAIEDNNVIDSRLR